LTSATATTSFQKQTLGQSHPMLVDKGIECRGL
jgi:hypothetical protein